MADWQVANDIGARLSELREMLGETQSVFAERFGRRKNQVGLWERGEHMPPRSVLERAAAQNHWPIILFQQGAPRPSEIYFPTEPDDVVRDVARRMGVAETLQEKVNEALADIVRWTAEEITVDQAASRAIQWIYAIGMVAQAELRDGRLKAEESVDLIRALHRQIAILGEGRAAGSPVPPAKAAGGE